MSVERQRFAEMISDAATLLLEGKGPIPMRRVWAMPSADTFDIAPIGGLVRWYLSRSEVSVDPFARNKRWATYTNDLNPNTAAENHVDALEFLQSLLDRGVVVDLAIFDPPYSPTQIKECYEGIGGRTYRAGEQNWVKERDLICKLVSVGGFIISCGWNSQGVGVGRETVIEEMLIVAHGAAHNDTIVTVERKVVSAQTEMFAP